MRHDDGDADDEYAGDGMMMMLVMTMGCEAGPEPQSETKAGDTHASSTGHAYTLQDTLQHAYTLPKDITGPRARGGGGGGGGHGSGAKAWKLYYDWPESLIER